MITHKGKRLMSPAGRQRARRLFADELQRGGAQEKLERVKVLLAGLSEQERAEAWRRLHEQAADPSIAQVDREMAAAFAKMLDAVDLPGTPDAFRDAMGELGPLAREAMREAN